MASVIDTMAETLGNALASQFHVASLSRATTVTGSDPADPPAPTMAAHSCRALILMYNKMLIAAGYAEADQRSILILANSVDVEPIINDVVTMSAGPFTGQSFTILSVDSDPARATWDCKGRPG